MKLAVLLSVLFLSFLLPTHSTSVCDSGSDCSGEVSYRPIGLGPRGTRRRLRGQHLDNRDYPQVTTRPVVGILSLPIEGRFEKTNATSFVTEANVRWLEQGGVRVIPILYNWRWSSTRFALDRLNGVAFQSGVATIWRNRVLSPYAERACAIYYYIQDSNRETDLYYPIWASGAGLQLLQTCAQMRESTVHTIDLGPNLLKQLKFAPATNSSRLFSYSAVGKRTQSQIEGKPLFLIDSQTGVAAGRYRSIRNLTSSFNVLATTEDINRKSVVVMVEGHQDPFYGVLFAPEQSAYEWRLKDGVLHSRDALDVSRYFAIFFGGEARRCKNEFESEKALKPWLIYNWKMAYVNQTSLYFLR